MATIYKRGSVWYSKLKVHGKTVRKRLDTDKKIAMMKLGRLIEQQNAARFGRPIVNPTYQEFKEKFNTYLDSAAQETKEVYQRSLRNLEQFTHITHLDEITPDLLMDLKKEWKTRKRGLYVVNKELKCLKAFMRQAAAMGYARPMDWKMVKMDPEPTGRVLKYSVTELQRLYNKVESHWKTVIMLGARAGLRRGEIAGLQWSDISWDRNTILVASDPETGFRTKTGNSRAIPMTSDLRTYLLKIKPRATSQWVFTGPMGKRLGLETISTYYARIPRRVGLKGSIYTLRHTYGAHLAMQGVPLNEIARLMGHKSIQTTMIYAHLMPSALAGAVNKIEFYPEVGTRMGTASSQNVSPRGFVEEPVSAVGVLPNTPISDGTKGNPREP